MRKASQDGGDSTSITSGTENEIKKAGPGILKSTKNSIKRKVQNFSHESDDTANEPLLHKNKEVRPIKELSEVEKQSAKFLLSKTKTEYASEKGNDKDKLLADDKIEKPSITDVTGITDAPISNVLKDKTKVTSQSILTTSIHSHMNTNVCDNSDAPKSTVIAKTQILIELDTSKSSGYSPSPLIFTTAKIHTDGKMQQMEPVQVTPVPILSTIENSVLKTETKILDIENTSKQHKENCNIAGTAPVTQVASISKLPEKQDLQAISNVSLTANSSVKTLTFGNKCFNNDNKAKVTQNGSEVISSKSAVTHVSNISKTMAEDSLKTKISQPSIQNIENVANKVGHTQTKIQESKQVAKSNEISQSIKKDFTKTISNQATSSIAKNCVDINKNFQAQPKQDAVRQTEPKIPDHKSVTSPPSTGTISIKEVRKSSCAKDDRTIDSIVNTKENKTENNPENKIRSSIVKSPDKQQALSTVSSGKLSSEKQSINKGNTLKSPENLVSHTDGLIAMKLIPSSTDSSANKVPSKEHTININKNVSTIEPIEALSTSERNTVKTSESRVFKTDSSLPSTIKGVSKSAFNTTEKETNISIKPTSEEKTLSNITNHTTSASTKFSVTSSVIISPQATSSMKSVTSVNEVPPANNIMKTMTSTPTTSNSKTSGRSFSSSISPTIVTTEDSSLKYKSNNMATVVSSISKPTTSATSSKFSSLSTSSKSPSMTKPPTPPSTVKTISSIPIATVSSVPQDKTSTKRASTPLNKPISSVSNNTINPASSIPKEPSAASNKGSTITSNENVVVTSTKPATKSSTHSDVKPIENTKDSKGSIA